ncbi:SPRY domain-containing SOCS box protein 3 [Trichonephila inaurata madagascariensis]|uniref:SPRY domain-containing SOCS box protein 3 n=1 Tax=Trichonephila inaurata madagascariensis TaxID=2747483 RepID=A0A8X6XQ72_9ARAC|nr:SPRY domain-containing SOCS box protein 3 [Trichonephila inaurata madagascariensis]
MSQADGPPLANFCNDNWTWNIEDKSRDVNLCGENLRTAHFHPNWSNGTAGVRGTRALNGRRYYWEIAVSNRIFGTSMMFGVCTKKARLHVNNFVNLLGECENGWGLSHKGLLWHKGKWRQYTKLFSEDEATTIGLLFDGIKGTLTYYKDGYNLGVAFTDLHLVKDELYPVVCSTAARTEMSLGIRKREYFDLQDMCRGVILASIRQRSDIEELPLPQMIQQYVADEENAMENSQNGEMKCNCFFLSDEPLQLVW